MLNIKYSNQAQLDLENAISHIANESVVNALNYLSRYDKKIELLKVNPCMGVECKTKMIKRDCRVLVHESHIVVYEINKNEIFIIRVFHTREEYIKKLNSKGNK